MILWSIRSMKYRYTFHFLNFPNTPNRGMMIWEKKVKVGCSVVSNSLQPHGLYSPWNSPGQNTGVGSLSLLQGVFSTQELKPSILHWRQILYHLSHNGSHKGSLKSTGVGSPSLLQWIIPAQGYNWGLLHCR